MQAQLVKQRVTNQQSQLLIHELISVSIYCVTFLRDVFEENNYIDTKYYNERYPRPDANYIRTKRLRPGITTFADLIIKCVDEGIKDSIERGYLKAVLFVIQIPSDGGYSVCESYMFGINYLTNQVLLSVNNNNKTETEVEVFEYDQIISQIQGMIKRLIVMTQSFDLLPREKSVLIKLLFNDSCPKDYQPPHFVDASDLPPTTIKIDKKRSSGINDLGCVNTGCNKVKLSVLVADKTGVSSMDVDPFDVFDGCNDDEPIGDVPPASSSLHLDSFLNTGGNETAAPTQFVSASASASASASFLSLHAKVVAVAPTCQKCNVKLNLVEYGYNKTPLKRPLTCTKCMFGSNIDKDLIVLQKIRLLWDYLCHHEFPNTKQLLALTRLTLSDGDIFRSMFNHLLLENVLVINRGMGGNGKLQFEHGTINYRIGCGEFTAMVDGIIDNYGTPLIKNQCYCIIFVPMSHEQFPYLSYNESLVDLYFPNLQLPRINFVKLNLRKFKARCLQNETQFDSSSGGIGGVCATVIPDSQASPGVVAVKKKKQIRYRAVPRVVESVVDNDDDDDENENDDEGKEDAINIDASSIVGGGGGGSSGGDTIQQEESEEDQDTIMQTTKQVKDLSFADSIEYLFQEPLPLKLEETTLKRNRASSLKQLQERQIKKRKVSVNKV